MTKPLVPEPPAAATPEARRPWSEPRLERLSVRRTEGGPKPVPVLENIFYQPS